MTSERQPARTADGRYDGPDGRLNELADIKQRFAGAAAARGHGNIPSEAIRAGHAVNREIRAERRRRNT